MSAYETYTIQDELDFDLELPEVDEEIELEPIDYVDLPEVDPHDDDEDAVLDDEEKN